MYCIIDFYHILIRFGDSLLRSLNLILESLNHNDFEFKLNKPKRFYQEKPRLPSRITKVDSFVKEKSFVTNKLPSINEAKRSKTNLNLLEKQKSSHSSVMMSHKHQPSEANTYSRFTFKRITYDIDKFTLAKSLDVIDKPWSLNQATSSVEARLNKLKTENLIEKLKFLLQNKYRLNNLNIDIGIAVEIADDLIKSKDSFEVINDIHAIDENIEHKLVLPKSHNRNRSHSRESSAVSRKGSSKSRKNSVSKKIPDDLKTIYLKKLKNNFYDRKLWNSLTASTNMNRNNFNCLTEKSYRDYAGDFNILKQNDWTNSDFAKCDFILIF